MGSQSVAMETEAVAIVGLSFRMPREAVDEPGLWGILENAKNVMTEWPESRLNIDAFYERGSKKPNMIPARGGHFLEEHPSVFDAPFFSITSKEVASMDPQQRHALEVVYHALENAGLPVETLRGTKTAVYVASMADDYGRLVSKDPDVAARQAATGSAASILPNRLSWFFNLRGPSVFVDTACSGSMIAIDLACQAMRNGDASAAIVLGSNIMLSPENSLLLGNINFLSPDSRCFSFDARANGYARGEGVIALVLKPLDAALRHGDVIRAVVRGTGANQDGRTPVLTQPSAEAQEMLIRHVYQKAGLGFGETRYLEAHGTGTPTGDPIEMSAIGRVFRTHRSSREPLLVGSVKANVGHLEGASGLAGVVKSILILEKGVVPPNALFEKMNPEIDAEFYNLKVPTKCIPWPTSGLRRISVNSFGFGGANAHIILDDAYSYLQDRGMDGYHHCVVGDALANGAPNGSVTESSVVVQAAENGVAINGDADTAVTHVSHGAPKLLVWSAADSNALQRLVQAYSSYFRDHITGNGANLSQLAYTLAARRSVMSWRTYAVVDESGFWDSIVVSAAGEQQQHDSPSLPTQNPIRASAAAGRSGIAFIFTGQGAQYVEMGLELLRHYPVVEESMRESDRILTRLGCEWSILDELRNAERINLPEVSQPLCTALQIALVEFLRSCGVVPAVVVGHSSGEIAAAYTIGALSHESACKAAYFRGQVAGQLRKHAAAAGTPGAMMSVNLSPETAPAWLEKRKLNDVTANDAVHVACHNSAGNVTLSGPSDAIDAAKLCLDQEGVFAHKLKTGVAYHSPVMRSVADEYLALMGTLESQSRRVTKPMRSRIPMISTVTGDIVAPELLATPQYWVENLVSPVRFVDAVHRLTPGVTSSPSFTLPPGIDTLTDVVEIGPHGALKRSVLETIPSSVRYHSVLDRSKSAVRTTLELLGALFCHGHPVSLLAGNRQLHGRMPFLVDCPPYPFDHSRRYWTESRLSKQFRSRAATPGYLLGRQAYDWNTMRPRWRNWLCTETIPWLGHHVVSGVTVCPGSGMLVMAIEAVKQMTTAQHRALSGFYFKEAEFRAPITVGETHSEATETELHLRPVQNANEKGPSWFDISIFSYRDQCWTECFRALVEAQYQDTESKPVDGGCARRLVRERIRERVEHAIASNEQVVDSSAFYQFWDKRGLAYGDSFQLLRDIAWDGHNNASARIVMKEENKPEEESRNHLPDVADSPVHPAVLDAAIHLLTVQMSRGLAETVPTMVPRRVSDLWISSETWASAASRAVHLGSILHRDDERTIGFSGTVYVAADNGIPLCTIGNVSVASVSSGDSGDGGDDGTQESDHTLIYSMEWKPQLSALSAGQLQQLCDHHALSQDETLPDGEAVEMESFMRLAVRRALKKVTDQDIQRGPLYLAKYAAYLRRLCSGESANGEVQEDETSDAEFETLLQELGAGQLTSRRALLAVARFLPSILKGETDPLELLFSTDDAKAFYTHLYQTNMVDGRFRSFMDLASHESPGLRILEVGAGTGGMTRHVLGTLQDFERKTGQARFGEYVYTDISPAFFGTARSEFAAFRDRLVFKTMDIERDAAAQGFRPGSYDMIIAGSVLHATADLAATLANVRSLLKDGGRLVIQEVTNTTNVPANVCFGTLEGWWLGTEDWRQDGALASHQRWDELLRATGFAGNELVLRDYKSEVCHLSSIMVTRAVDMAPPDQQQQAPAKASNVVFLVDSELSDVQRALASSLRATKYPDAREIYLASDDDNTDNEDDNNGGGEDNTVVVSLVEFGASRLASMTEREFLRLRRLIQRTENLLWVTSGELSGADNASAVAFDPHAAIAQGFLRSVRNEETSKRIVVLTIEACPAGSEAGFVNQVVQSCFGKTPPARAEVELTVRDGQLTIGRMRQEPVLEAERLARTRAQMHTEPWQPGPALALEVGTPGMLDTLRFVEDTSHTAHDGVVPDLGSDEVEIENVVCPVSFRDVLIGLGRLGREKLGFECAGVVTRTGSACTGGFEPGDRVVMVMPGCMRSHPRAPAHNVFRIPAALSFEEAVAVINPGATAYQALVNVARLGSGEKVLIHSAAGATGQMAVGIAQMLGAEVFATVGSAEKKQLLGERFGIPDDHIFYSRDTLFAQAIMRQTAGGGVDVVLNSLSGDGLRASWECIGPYGRFVEIGKADIRANSPLPMACFAKNVSFSAVDLHHIVQTNTALMRQLVDAVLGLVADWRRPVHPPSPLHVYPVSDVEKAFRYMQGGKNAGRIIISMNREDVVPKFIQKRSTWRFPADASYLIAGGFGGIGRAILLWMADKGARNLIVLSRSGASGLGAQEVMSELAKRGVRVLAPRCDLSSASKLAAVLETGTATMPPIKGCINAAMALKDAIFENMTYTQWSQTIGSKVHASWNLHTLLPRDMDFFIFLSSLAGIYGTIAQSNYTAGCAFQDALARARTLAPASYPGKSVSLDLGWMRTIGIVAEHDEYRRNRENAKDMAPVETADLMAVLDRCCDPVEPVAPAGRGDAGAGFGTTNAVCSQVLIGAVIHAHFYARGEQPIPALGWPAFSGFDVKPAASDGKQQQQGSSVGAAAESAARLFAQADSAERRVDVVVMALQAKLAGALGVAAEEVDTGRALSDYGVDSLMAVELRNWIRRDFAGASVAVFEILGAGTTIAGIGRLVVERVS